MELGNENTGYPREAAFFSGLLAGALFSAIWSALIAVMNLWGDLGTYLVAVFSAAVAAATTSYRIGSSPARVGVIAVFSLFAAIVLTMLLAITISPLEPIYVTISERQIAFYAVTIAFGALMATIFGKREA